jgi:hypothetical protein
LKELFGHNMLILAMAISLAGIALNKEAVNFQPSATLKVPDPISPNPIGTNRYCIPLAV